MAPTIELKDEVEGELVETSDFFFDRVGEPVPVRPTGGGGGGGGPELYDPGRLPSQPLAVSERFRLVFVAHASGFCVARTGDVVEAAKEMKEKGSRSSVLELSVVDVPLGRSACSGFLPILPHLRLLLGELSTSSQSIRFSIRSNYLFFPAQLMKKVL